MEPGPAHRLVQYKSDPGRLLIADDQRVVISERELVKLYDIVVRVLFSVHRTLCPYFLS